MTKIKNTYILFIAIVASLLMLHGCSDDEQPRTEDKHVLNLIAYGISRAEDSNYAKVTRALPTGYETYASNADESISLILYDDAEKTQSQGSFTHTKGQEGWKSNISLKSDSKYYVFGFMPSRCAATSTVTSADYSQGATMTLTGLNTIMSEDVCVVTGVKKATGASQHIADCNIEPGAYAHESSNTEDEYIFLLFDHIYSCLDLQFLIDADYDNLRTIKIKKVMLKCTDGASTAKATIILPYGSKAMSISWETQETGGITIDNLLATNEVITLSATDSHSVCSYILPQDAFSFSLTTEYDVYDKKGNLVRGDCKATNKLTMPKLDFGKKYPLKLKVQPTYLYQLSEPDLDNPTIKLG